MADKSSAPDPAPASRAPGRRRARWPWLLALAVVAAAAWWWYHRQAQPEAQSAHPRRTGAPPAAMAAPPTPVKAEAARTEDLDVFIKALGTVTSFNTVTVRSRVDGELEKVLFREGQRVKAGDLLVQIDPRPFQVQLSQAEGALQQNQAQLDNARRDLQRYETLFSQDSIARQQVDTQAALVRQYEGSIKTNQAAVDNAKLQLSYTRVTAPAPGRLGLRQVDQGNLVRSSDTNGLVVITQTQPISVLFTIAETELPNVMQELRAGHRLPVEAYDRADIKHIADGMLDTVDNQIDVATGTVKLKARFENKDETLFPNQFINVRLHVRTLKNAIVIPAAAVQRGTPGTFVYVVRDDNTIAMRVIKLGMLNGERIAVQDGLQAGERVVTDGVDRLREGAKVRVVADPAAGQAAGQAPRLRAPAATAAPGAAGTGGK